MPQVATSATSSTLLKTTHPIRRAMMVTGRVGMVKEVTVEVMVEVMAARDRHRT